MYHFGEIFRESFETYESFYGAYLFSKSANSIFKIHIGILRDDLKNRVFKYYSITTTKDVVKILQ